MKTSSKIICDAELISRYIDNELDDDELAGVKTHITDCASCRKRFDDYDKIGARLNSLIKTRTAVTAGTFENKVTEAIRKKNNAGFHGWKDVIFSKRMWAPVGLAVSITLMFMFFSSNPAPIGPTAIVSSLSGSGSSVVILETTETRQTIIWYSENG